MKAVLITLAVVGAIGLATGTAGAERTFTDSPKFVVNKQIGDVRMGESEARVGYEYGADCLAGCPGLQDGSLPGMRLIKYKLHGGYIRIGYHAQHVVYLETNASYYRSDRGLGVGTLIPFGKRYGSFQWHRCTSSEGYWITPGSLATQLATLNGTVASIQIWSAYLTTEVGRQEC